MLLMTAFNCRIIRDGYMNVLTSNSGCQAKYCIAQIRWWVEDFEQSLTMELFQGTFYRQAYFPDNYGLHPISSYTWHLQKIQSCTPIFKASHYSWRPYPKRLTVSTDIHPRQVGWSSLPTHHLAWPGIEPAILWLIAQFTNRSAIWSPYQVGNKHAQAFW